MSRSVLEQLGKTIRVSGMPWLKPDETLEIGLDSLTAKILCKRHNESLSPLDVEAGIYFDAQNKAFADLAKRRLSRKPTFHMVGGEALELWMLKATCGVYFSIGMHNDGKKMSETLSIDMAKVHRAFFDGRWDERGGLYFIAASGNSFEYLYRITMRSLFSEKTSLFTGSTISMNGISMQIIFDDSEAFAGPWLGLVRRPADIVIENKGRRHYIMLTWPYGTPGPTITMTKIRQ